MSLPCGCQARKEVMSAGNWHTDAYILAGAITLLMIQNGGKMSTTTRRLINIGIAGAVAAVLIDGLLKPNIKGA